MSVRVVKTYKETLPRTRFIGKKYTNKDRGVDGGFGYRWQQWFEHYFTEEISLLAEAFNGTQGQIGLMTCTEEEDSFEYFTGVFTAMDAPVPEGYDFIDFSSSDIAVCWLQGNPHSGEMYGQEPHNMCLEQWQLNDMDHYREFQGKRWYFFERYNTPRFTEVDDRGEAILDYCMFLNE